MFKFLKYFLLFFIVMFLSACSLPFSGSGAAALNVNSTPVSSVFLNGEKVGITPFYNEKLKAGEYTVKLVPEQGTSLPWESRVTLTAGVRTVISRELGENIDSSSGYVLTMTKTKSGDKSSFVAVTIPDSSMVSIDGETKGFSPIEINDIATSEHLILVSSPGYLDKSIKAKVFEGYDLSASIQLARLPKTQILNDKDSIKEDKSKKDKIEDDEVIDEDIEIRGEKKDNEDNSKNKLNDISKPYVIIQDTPTGWLNVREKPTTTTDNIIQKVDPGDKYPFVELNDSGWYQIKLDSGDKGWISGKYAKLVE